MLFILVVYIHNFFVFNFTKIQLKYHFLLDFGDLLFMRRWYLSCACLMPSSPVTVFIVTKGSSNRSLRRAMVSLKSLLYCSINVW